MDRRSLCDCLLQVNGFKLYMVCIQDFNVKTTKELLPYFVPSMFLGNGKFGRNFSIINFEELWSSKSIRQVVKKLRTFSLFFCFFMFCVFAYVVKNIIC